MEEQLNKPETQTNEQAETRANEHPSEQTDSRMTELTIKQSTKRSSVKISEPAKVDEHLNDQADSSFVCSLSVYKD